ncbi:MAG: bifunctional phosphoribosyl-AMP cyclohydrolase/phosphoribosyl-ATP diphosphatase HisIE [Ignavibacteriae bacterium]|nr:bifunctional phosphoribosyl-AMP cyclohydrolase/phosphoribosyl-ATP diphosphatase HisIE [Ignavibacteriota bacterium]NOH00257.1 bifunctional phosphoribosyl-AMP cyclohydrolase/phosphoribosyl-ATP diphosphatase HisIE [Ignavibacteriota bacterium]
MININEIDFTKLNGLVPAVIVDKNYNNVLMLGFMNKEALEITIESGHVTFFSRTKNRIWTKGETSKNYLLVDKIFTDCDNDSLLIYASPQGNTCHKEQYSCFGIERSDKNNFLFFLSELIKSRKKEMPSGSYTTSLFEQGINRIVQKVGEEAVETVIAAKNDDKEELINEVSDLLFHLLVLMEEKNISLQDVNNNLMKRHNK